MKALLLTSLAGNAVLLLALCIVWPQASRTAQRLSSDMNVRIEDTQAQLTTLRSSLQGTSSSLELVKGQLIAQGRATTAAENTNTGKPWLTIGMTTVPRRSRADYLSRTLETLMEELPLDPTDPLYARVNVLVMNNRPGNHSVFAQVQARINSPTAVDGEAETAGQRFVRKAQMYVRMMDNPGTVPDPAPQLADPDDFNNPSNRPGREVRRQTCDLISLLQSAHNASHYFMFMEDDFRVCPNALRIVGYAVRKLNSQPKLAKWLALRVSYGMNGILLRDEHLPQLATYLRKHTARLPADLLWMEWIQGRKRELWDVTKGRPLAVYRSNLLDHIGAQSSFAVRTNRLPWPGCFESMATVWSLHKSERFQLSKCPNSDISPCPALEEDADSWLKYAIDWPRIMDGAEHDHPETLADAVVNATAQATDTFHVA